MRRHTIAVFTSAAAVCLLSATSFGSLAKKAGGAGTSSTTSSSPTVQKQAELMDPDFTAADDTSDDLQLSFARLDLVIDYTNVPDHLKASNLIESITVTPLPHFEAVSGEPLPSYDGSTDTPTSFHVDMDQGTNGREVDIHDIAIQADPSDPPPVGEINHVEVDIQYFDFLSTDAYDAIDATFNVVTSDGDSDEGIQPSEIQGIDPSNPDAPPVTYGPGEITPSSSSDLLGAPEPAMLGPLAGLLLISLRKRGIAA
jgi:hypothetical protein